MHRRGLLPRSWDCCCDGVWYTILHRESLTQTWHRGSIQKVAVLILVLTMTLDITGCCRELASGQRKGRTSSNKTLTCICHSKRWPPPSSILGSEKSWEQNSRFQICGIWKNWYRRSYLQSRNRDTDVENKCIDTKGKGGRWDELGDWDWNIYTIDTMYKIDN